MGIRNRFFLPLALLSLVFSQLLLACKPSLEQEQAEAELVDFVLDTLITQQVGDAEVTLAPEGQSYQGAAVEASLLVYAPLKKPAGEHPYTFQLDEPLQAWWLAEHTLYQSSDLAGDIARYRQEAIVASPSAAWHFTAFGIASIDRQGSQAEVYVEISCGMKCGTGVLYTLQRDEAGQWEIVDSELVMIV